MSDAGTGDRGEWRVEGDRHEAGKSAPVKLVLDTSVLTNPDTARQWGRNAAEALQTLVDRARAASDQLALYMPPSILEELKTFMNEDEIPGDLELVITLRAPNRYGVTVPGALLYELIDDIRQRIDRGLRVAEKMVRQAGSADPDKVVTQLRGQYRDALRSGLLDSREDVDVILLASELEAAVVSSDRAVTRWAETLGLRLIQPGHLRRVFEARSA